MKKMMLMIAMIFALSTTYAFTGEEAVCKQALSSFRSEFSGAHDVSWTAGNNYYKVSFTLNEQQLFAFYGMEGEYLGVSRYISSLQLPINLQTGLKKNYSNYWISDLFETATGAGSGYYMTLENADSRIVLKSVDGSDWTVYSKSKKA
jgi:hypothetical protein